MTETHPEALTTAPDTELSLTFDDAGYAKELFGPQNANLNRLERLSGVRGTTRGNTVTLKGEQYGVGLIQKLLAQLYGLLRSGNKLQPNDMEHAYTILSRSPESDLQAFFSAAVFSSSAHKRVVSKTVIQRA